MESFAWYFVFAFLGAQPAAPVWTFHDAAAYDGRTLLSFRAVELADRPVRPLAETDVPATKALFSLLPIGTSRDHFTALVWLPETGEVWVDSDGDGRFSSAERHRLGEGALEVPIILRMAVAGAEPARLQRTLVLRRSIDGGLRYAMRGYVTGTLRLAGRDYGVLLTDGNADGCFDSAAHDRICIDLDNDGHFDFVTEQFPLGKPLAIGGKMYLVKPEPDGSQVHVRERPTATGTVRLRLTEEPKKVPLVASINLVSDWGELVTVTNMKEAISLPAGRYAVDSMRFKLADETGRPWQYSFAGPRRFDIEVTAGLGKVVSVLKGLRLQIDLQPRPETVRPGYDVYVTPKLQTPMGLYMVNCEKCERFNEDFVSWHADIRLTNSAGEKLAGTQTSFL